MSELIRLVQGDNLPRQVVQITNADGTTVEACPPARQSLAVRSAYVPGSARTLGALAAVPEDRSLQHVVEPVWLTRAATASVLRGGVTSAPLRAEVL